jgi:hypothetical protein
MAEIGATLHPDLAIGPGLSRSPFNGVITVFDIIPEGFPFSLGFEAAAYVLINENVAARREVHRHVDQELQRFLAFLSPPPFDGRYRLGAVGSPRKNDWVPAIRDRPVDIGVKTYTVAHRNRNPILHPDIIPRSRRPRKLYGAGRRMGYRSEQKNERKSHETYNRGSVWLPHQITRIHRFKSQRGTNF